MESSSHRHDARVPLGRSVTDLSGTHRNRHRAGPGHRCVSIRRPRRAATDLNSAGRRAAEDERNHEGPDVEQEDRHQNPGLMIHKREPKQFARSEEREVHDRHQNAKVRPNGLSAIHSRTEKQDEVEEVDRLDQKQCNASSILRQFNTSGRLACEDRAPRLRAHATGRSRCDR